MASPSPSALPALSPLPPKLGNKASESEPKKTPSTNKTPRVPTPQELVSHYESQGLDTNEASMRAIEDLQQVLVKVVGSIKGRKERFAAETTRKLDAANSRISVLQMKLDTKPGYAETLAIGVLAGGIVKGVGSVVPHVVGAVGQIWRSVKGATEA